MSVSEGSFTLKAVMPKKIEFDSTKNDCLGEKKLMITRQTVQSGANKLTTKKPCIFQIFFPNFSLSNKN